jgi:nitroreductase
MRFPIACPLLLTLGTLAAMATAAMVFAEELKPMTLPPARTTGGKPLLEALKARHSSREFAAKELPAQVLGDLLWAGFGINRPDDGHRTAPSAMNWQEIDIYVVTARGTWLYDAKPHALKPVAAGDLRKLAGMQDFVAEAPVNLVYVADTTRVTRVEGEARTVLMTADAAFIAENVYLFCASEGLAVVVRASVDKVPLAKALNLRPEQTVVLAQTVGYPK